MYRSSLRCATTSIDAPHDCRTIVVRCRTLRRQQCLRRSESAETARTALAEAAQIALAFGSAATPPQRAECRRTPRPGARAPGPSTPAGERRLDAAHEKLLGITITMSLEVSSRPGHALQWRGGGATMCRASWKTVAAISLLMSFFLITPWSDTTAPPLISSWMPWMNAERSCVWDTTCDCDTWERRCDQAETDSGQHCTMQTVIDQRTRAKRPLAEPRTSLSS